MQTEFAQDLVDADQPIHAAIAERPGKPLRLRVQPMIMRGGRNGKPGQYHSWKGVSWSLECDSAAEAFATKEALRAFFETLGRLGPGAVHAALQAVNTATTATMARKGAA